jgi:hypothetical protein
MSGPANFGLFVLAILPLWLAAMARDALFEALLPLWEKVAAEG